MDNREEITHGGDLVARVLEKQGVKFIFTLSGGHISPILVAAKARGIRVIDTRDERSAAFAADAVAKLTGIPGVAVVTAGPGVTNTITAIKNAQMEESPLLVLGGATATVLMGRGSLQDIDHIALVKPLTKMAVSIKRVRDIVLTLEKAFDTMQNGIPGPVFIELPVDVLYDEKYVRAMYGVKDTPPKTWMAVLMQWYLKMHLNRLFSIKPSNIQLSEIPKTPRRLSESRLRKLQQQITQYQRPVLILGSQAVNNPAHIPELKKAIVDLNMPVYLTGMARGLLGKDHPLHMRHQRRKALKDADLVILAGLPLDFRLDYGRVINRKATLASINLSSKTLRLNWSIRKINFKVQADPARSLIFLAEIFDCDDHKDCWPSWHERLRGYQEERNQEIDRRAGIKLEKINPLYLSKIIEEMMDENSVIAVDGGDFIATVSYIVQPRDHLRWANPGVFGPLGSGGGYALASKLVYPDSEVWLLYGDGSSGYSLAEFDTMVRHNLPVIAVVGNDASWQQIAREQIEFFDDDVAVTLEYSDYHKVAEGYGAVGILVEKEEEIRPAIVKAKKLVKEGKPVLINVFIDKTDFRKGSLSV